MEGNVVKLQYIICASPMCLIDAMKHRSTLLDQLIDTAHMNIDEISVRLAEKIRFLRFQNFEWQ